VPLDARLLEILVCPACSASLAYEPDHDRLTCRGCGLVYPIRDGIPVLLVEEAMPAGRDGADG